MDAVLDVLGKIGFDWQVALANLVNFLIIFFLLKRFAFAPIQRLIARRQEYIKQGLDNRSRADEMIAEAKAEAQAMQMEARTDANTILAKAHAQSKDMLLQAEQHAEQRASAIIDDAHKALEQDKAAMLREVQKVSGDLIVGAVEKIIDTDVDASVRAAAASRIADTVTS